MKEEKKMNDINRNINLENINFDAGKKFYYDQKGKLQEKTYFKGGWCLVLNISLATILLVMLKLYYNIHFLPLDLLSTETCINILGKITSKFASNQNFLHGLLFCITLYTSFLFVCTTAYNIFDLVALPYWLIFNKRDQRQWWRGEYIVFVCLLPLKLPFIIIKFWFTAFLAMFGINTEELPDKRKSESNTTSTTNNKVTTSSASSTDISKLTDEIVNVYANANSAGVPVEPYMFNEVRTNGATQEELQIALENAKIYLNDLGYK